MMVAGNTCIITPKDVCEETYDLVRKNSSTGISGLVSNVLLFPSAKKYVERLFRDAGGFRIRAQLRGRLAVVTGAHKGCPGYHVAEELAVAAGMDVVLVGKSQKKLQEAANAILEGAKKRDHNNNNGDKSGSEGLPRLYQVRMNSNSLRSVSLAADEIHHISHDINNDYKGQLHIVVNLGGEVYETYSMTEEGVDVNIGRNYLAPRLLTDRLLPLLRAAATPTYKPRIIHEGSLGHCRGSNFDPQRLRKCPPQGGGYGAPPPDDDDDDDAGTTTPVVVLRKHNNNNNNGESSLCLSAGEREYASSSSSSLSGGLELYYRSKMALMADTLALSKEEPMLAAVSCDTGILNYATTPATTGSRGGGAGFSLLNLSPSQGARSALRAALDPAFNDNHNHTTTTTTTAMMQYLHCDGNPWTMSDPTVIHPRTGVPYGMEEYAEMVRSVGDDIIGQLMADKDCQVELCLRSLELSLSSSLLVASSSAGGFRRGRCRTLSSSSSSTSSSSSSSSSTSDHHNRSFGGEGSSSSSSTTMGVLPQKEASTHPSLLLVGRTYSSLFSQ